MAQRPKSTHCRSADKPPDKAFATKDKIAAGSTDPRFEKQLEFDQLLADFSARFVSLPSEEIDDEIRKAFVETLKFFQIDRLTLLQLLPNKCRWQAVYSADAKGISPYPIRTPLAVSLVPWFFEKLAGRREVVRLRRRANCRRKRPTTSGLSGKWEYGRVCISRSRP